MASATSAAVEMVTATITGAAGAAIATTLVAPVAKKSPSESLLDPHHLKPTHYNPSAPIVLFIIQATIIIGLAAFLGLFLKKIRQPRVIAEVIGGIILGPSAMGRVAGFTENIFPPASIPGLNLVANIGLILFLFIVGLETDIFLIRRNWRAATGVGFIGLAVPFALGAAVARGLYNEFMEGTGVAFGNFLLFISVAFAITAMPVLCRILTELKLLKTSVGMTTLAAGVFNDVVGWILLALAVTLVNAGSGVTAVYVLLTVVGWVLFLVYAIRPVFIWLARRSGSFGETGPTQGMICLTLLLTFASAWITQVIGVHAIFGGFLVGLIMPHSYGFASHMTSKIEDLVSAFFLPLYFALSGLSTNLGLLNDGSIWGWAICVIVVAQLSKFLPCFFVGLATGKDWRESGAIGSLMACKGLVELIVLNIGLNAKILTPPVFAMFVLMALVTTFATTPLTIFFYPESYRIKQAAAALIEAGEKGSGGAGDRVPSEGSIRSRFVVVLNRLEHLPSMMAFVKLLQPPVQYNNTHSSEAEAASPKGHQPSSKKQAIQIEALRLVELSSRTSDVMRATDLEEAARADPMTHIFSTFCHLNGISVEPTLSIVQSEDFSTEIAGVATAKESDMVIVPWSGSHVHHHHAPSTGGGGALDKLFGESHVEGGSPQYASLVRHVFSESTCDVALIVEQPGTTSQTLTSSSKPWSGAQHIFFPFHGGPDDRASLEFVIQMCQHPGVSASIVRIVKSAEPTVEDGKVVDSKESSTGDETNAPHLLNQLTVHAGGAGSDTVYGTTTPAGKLQSETADNLIWAKYFARDTGAGGDVDTTQQQLSRETQVALTRIEACEVSTFQPLKTTLRRSELAASTAQTSNCPLMMVAGRSRRHAESHAAELEQYLKERIVTQPHGGLGMAKSSEVRKTLGDVASAFVVAGVAGSILVVQAGSPKTKRLTQISEV